MLRYNGIIKEDTVNAEKGIHCTIFFQGCSHHCKGCYNPETWDFNSGLEFDENKQKEFIKLCNMPYIDAISLSGGDPLQQNEEEMYIFLKNLKEHTKKPIYCWTGYKYDDIKDNKLLEFIDVLIDGEFHKDELDNDCYLKGSINQQIIRITK